MPRKSFVERYKENYHKAYEQYLEGQEKYLEYAHNKGGLTSFFADLDAYKDDDPLSQAMLNAIPVLIVTIYDIIEDRADRKRSEKKMSLKLAGGTSSEAAGYAVNEYIFERRKDDKNDKPEKIRISVKDEDDPLNELEDSDYYEYWDR